MTRENLLKCIKQSVQTIEPDAQITLFGSRAREEAVSETSDWDFLILVDGTVDDLRKDKIRHCLYEIEWETGEIISSIIYSRQEWNSARLQNHPFHTNIKKEGLTV